MKSRFTDIEVDSNSKYPRYDERYPNTQIPHDILKWDSKHAEKIIQVYINMTSKLNEYLFDEIHLLLEGFRIVEGIISIDSTLNKKN